MNEIKVGDILAGTWGYSMVIPVFYQVVKVTDKRIKLVELEKRMVSHDGYGQRGYEVPIQAVRDLDARLCARAEAASGEQTGGPHG